ncbi:hypothetical protein LJR289_004631 [Pseudoduganella sp. LjRoot289]|uniref:hypothetical protein n=1 Tax=Pseudoduganella sp. LjRoot289 TaxID=3342314 RepID=UPI003ECFD77D
MTHTLAAVFDNRSDAEKARSALLGAGFKDSDVRLSDPAPGGGTQTQAQPQTQSQTQSGADAGASIGGSIKHFFTKLFGEDDEENSQAYAEAVKRGNTVLTVQADSLDRVEHAADIVEGYGPVDIDERKSKWSASGWTGGSKGPAAGGRASGQYAGAQQSAQGGTAGSGAGGESRQGQSGGQSQQRASTGGIGDTGAQGVPVIHEEISIVSQGILRGGARIYERVVTSTVRPLQTDSQPRSSQDEASYRSHWTSNYGSAGGQYDDYAPAYRYGSEMAGSDAYRGRSWEESESSLRGKWESQHPQSAWDKVKAAVRHGWERLTS